MADTTQNFCLVLLDLHAAAATITPLPSLQLVIDLRNVNRHAGRQAFYNRDQRATV
jgi:hypothetical protein